MNKYGFVVRLGSTSPSIACTLKKMLWIISMYASCLEKGVFCATIEIMFLCCGIPFKSSIGFDDTLRKRSCSNLLIPCSVSTLFPAMLSAFSYLIVGISSKLVMPQLSQKSWPSFWRYDS